MENEKLNKRFTKQRQTIYDTLKETKQHPDANWIYAEVTKILPKISLGTVYRNLNILFNEKLINIISLQPNIIRYDGDTNKHFHIMCNKCFKIEDIGMESINQESYKECLNKIIAQYNYHEIEPHLFFTGICQDCINAPESPELTDN